MAHRQATTGRATLNRTRSLSTPLYFNTGLWRTPVAHRVVVSQGVVVEVVVSQEVVVLWA